MYGTPPRHSLSMAFLDTRIEESTSKRARIQEPPKNRVRFASFGRLEQVCATISRFEMTDDEIASCWWTSGEQEEARQLVGTMLKQASRSFVVKDFVDKTVNGAYHSACSAVFNTVGNPSQHLTNESVTQLCNDEAIVRSDILQMWTASCSPLQGLERPMMAKQRQVRAINHCRTVLRAFLKSAMATRMDIGDSSTCSSHSSVTERLMTSWWHQFPFRALP
jgi:hypothetical protein